MSLLSKQSIRKKLDDGAIAITPAPSLEDFDSDAVDVHLGDKVYEWTKQPGGATLSIAFWKQSKGPDEDGFIFNSFARAHLKEVPPDNAGVITLRPHSFYLADLKQHTKLPPDIAMHIQGKSSLARLGVLVHLTAPHAHAGWAGRLTLEIYNLGTFNIEMKSGMPIGQLTFWTVHDDGGAATGVVRSGQFDNQETAHGETK